MSCGTRSSRIAASNSEVQLVLELRLCIASNEAHFEKISGAANANEAWLILEACNQGAEQLKKVRLQTLRRQYELMQMNATEKILRTLTPSFDLIVVAIEESKRLEDMKVEDLQGSLEAHEQRIMERSIERPVEQALQAYIRKNFGGRSGLRGRGRGRDYKNYKNMHNKDQEKVESDKPETSIRRGGFNQWKGGRKMVDIKKIKCFNCGKVGHFSNECKASSNQSDNRSRHFSEAHMAKEEIVTEDDEQSLLLMMVTSQVDKNKDVWYIDSGCSSLMTGHRDWLVNLMRREKTQ
ncbi:PREDICTED: uncharacterized protein LOC109330803 [Lupinus angustifolius]|uniref:uncharacterized protein LOC109330803 n=1 Tax=Lupinus angustifolius TaxID=3871 RepID=UPI00092F9300|nr:PREDICTED: uncharacterized protein LOC109330803 [Lupinus angustifolius]